MLWCLGEAWSFQALREGYKLLFLLRAFFRMLGTSSGIRTAEGMYQGYKFGCLSLKSRVEGPFVEAYMLRRILLLFVGFGFRHCGGDL